MASPLGNTTYFQAREDNFAAPLVELKAIGDINGDGRLDIVTQQMGTDLQDKTLLVVALGLAGGGFAPDAPVFAGAVPEFTDARVMIGDYTGDGITDLAVYDAGYYDWSVRTTVGGEPVLFVGSAQGTFTTSDALKIAAQPFVQPPPTPSVPGGVQLDLTMGVKDVISADIDGDGDLDFWVESTGSRNITSHVLVNNGGTFSIDINHRVPEDTLFGPGLNDYWRYGHAEFLDLNSDGAPDLVLGQIRDNHITHIAQSSFVLLNDGHGYFPAANTIRLPLPDFYHGYTSAEAMDAWDINRDGRQDLVIVHTRNDDVSATATEPVEQAWTGTYVQVLIQQADGQFVDETAQRIGSQSTWSTASLQQGTHATSVQHADVNGDGVVDFILGYYDRPSATTPVLFLGRGDGSFAVGDSNWLTGGDMYFGEGITGVNLNGDAWLDFVHLDSHPGPNGAYNGPASDDYMSIVTQLGSGPLGGGGVAAALQLVGGSGADALSGGAAGDLLTGLGGNDTLQGFDGLDMAVYAGARGSHTVAAVQGNITIADATGSAGTDTLISVERARFSDGKLAFDLAGNAGDVAKVLGAVFGAAAVNNQQYAGIGLAYADGGMDIAALMSLALQVQLGANASNEAVVNLLYANVIGSAPPAGFLAEYVGYLASGQFTQASLGVMAAETSFNTGNIDLVGLAAHGLAYV
jgi:hypothetical protein